MEKELKTSKNSLVTLPILTKLSKSFDIIIPKAVEAKIRYLCNKIHEVEWSGVLFYSTKGGWDTNDLKVICKDIFLMDIGSSGYTEFDVNPDVFAYAVDNDLTDCYTGLCHSHNNMNTWFSGTDTATLCSEGNKQNHFVSLIVNNAGTYTAGITRHVNVVKNITETITYNTFENVEKTDNDVKYSKKEERIEWCNLNIIKEEVIDTFSEVATRIENIKASKERPAKHVNNSNISYYVQGNKAPYQRTLFDDKKYYKEVAVNNKKKDYKTTSLIDEVDTWEDVKPKRIISVDYYVLQLITGSISIADASRINPVKWANSMERLFDKRFKDISAYKTWAEGMIDYIVNEIDFDIDVIEEIVKKLDDLPSNKYIESLIEIFGLWTLDE